MSRLPFWLVVAFALLGAARSDNPEQIHIAFGDDISSMSVSWISDQETGEIQVGSTSGNYQWTFTSTAKTYTWQGYTSKYIHFAVATKLVPGAKYYYICGTGSSMSAEYSFSVAKATGPEVPVTLGIIGDLGSTRASTNTINHVRSNAEIDSVMFVGDLSYANGDQPKWDTWGKTIQPSAAYTPFMFAPGDHELWYGEDWVAYNARFRMPANGFQNLWYSYEVGSAHVTILSSYSQFNQSSPQYAWAMSDLRSVDRARTPWLIVLLHVPWYNSFAAHQGAGNAMREVWEPILNHFAVDMVFAGHVHAYERCTRTRDFVPTPTAPYYFTVGDGGSPEGLYRRIAINPPWSAFRKSAWGHGELQIYDSKTANFTWHDDTEAEAVVADHVLMGNLAALAPARGAPLPKEFEPVTAVPASDAE